MAFMLDSWLNSIIPQANSNFVFAPFDLLKHLRWHFMKVLHNKTPVHSLGEEKDNQVYMEVSLG